MKEKKAAAIMNVVLFSHYSDKHFITTLHLIYIFICFNKELNKKNTIEYWDNFIAEKRIFLFIKKKY